MTPPKLFPDVLTPPNPSPREEGLEKAGWS